MIEELPITDMLKSYWEVKKAGRPFPTEDEIIAAEMSSILPYFFLIEVLPENKFKYEFAGFSIVEAYGETLEETEIQEDPLYPESPTLEESLLEVINSNEPVHYEGAFINKNNQDIKFRKILLPVGENGKITYVIGAMRWKEY